jgi:hypothetical protein
MKQQEKKLKEVSASVSRYYDSLSDEEIAEDRAWGEFAAGQWVDENNRTACDQ